ncbi:MAG: hypothetical protein ABS99_09515 [Acetobacteraceae bacterium SCN 69-10]|mgnify:CR=1 FL=1|nr:MAPEG family protein [Rhodospirillales bacterium]ODU54345.1 MAG: hypothetical protein ABS99_09515 [Acetobacteraceae bacterium SCN 69-10]OJY67338.1 MAG: hypothetical protein BGP12_14475 [Rhodospirillales bacterium 70-18]
MTADLVWLVWSVALAFVLVVVAVFGAMLQVGLPALAGNRENLPATTGWAGRAYRAHRNMMENLPLFIALVVAAHLAGRADGAALTGCALFVWARAAHPVVYIVGIPWLRTLCWAVSVVGMGMILVHLLG